VALAVGVEEGGWSAWGHPIISASNRRPPECHSHGSFDPDRRCLTRIHSV